MIFLLDPNASWPARWIDAITGENEGGARVKRLRDELSQAWLAGYFTTPEDLARQVSAAVHRREMSDRLGTMELTIRTGLEDALMAGGPIKGRFTVRRTRLAPEMISTPPSPDFQKAPTRGPASLVAVRALAGRRPAYDTAIVGHRNFAIEHDLAGVPGPCRGAIHQDSAGRLPGQRSARDAPATPGRWPPKVGNLRDNYASPEHLSARGTAPWLPGRCSPIRKRPSAASKINFEYS